MIAGNNFNDKKGSQSASSHSQIPRRGLCRTEAAGYIGISPSLFDQLVKDGRMPKPIKINARVVWDRFKLDVAFEDLAEGSEDNPWDGESNGQH
jgi:predicted DNA-binding transcriptional regulator AlpA